MKSFKKFIEETKLAEKTEFRATAWSNGGDGYGLRVSKNDRDNFFKKSEKKVRLSFSDKNDSISIDITSSFWNNCTELRSAEIKDWFRKKRYLPWDKGYPPKFLIKKISRSHFKVIKKISR